MAASLSEVSPLLLAQEAAAVAVEGDDYWWELDTAELSEAYTALEFSSSVGTIQCVPVQLTPSVLTLMLPADTAPWLPTFLVPLSGPDSRTPAVDGQRIAAAFVRVAYSGGICLSPSSEFWTEDRRYPSRKVAPIHQSIWARFGNRFFPPRGCY